MMLDDYLCECQCEEYYNDLDEWEAEQCFRDLMAEDWGE